MDFRRPAREVQEWLDRLPPDKQAIVDALREIVAATMPDALESIYHDSLVYGPTERFNRTIYISVFSQHVNLGFFFGGDLDDPQRLLIGRGKRMRHIKITSREEVSNPAIRTLLAQAWPKDKERAAKFQ